jgi:NAD(P)-dependent dehydrogenase (short-subunit alcohol dehydrogenase family)
MSGTFVIFGGAGGIGLATARALKADGHALHLAGRDAGKLAAAAAELGATTTLGDVTDPAHFAQVAADAGAAVKGLVYAVGSINLKPVSRLNDADFSRDFELNALGAVRAVQALLPAMKACEGTAGVVLFSTVAVAQGFTAHASVAMAKGAVEGLTLALAAELAPKIRVNCIAPSLTKTPLAKALTGNEAMATAIAQMHALQRLGEAEDIAPMAALLASDKGSWITGQIIGIDGGRSSLRTKG